MTTWYKDKNILVLGGAGFIGASLVRQLLDAGAIVRVVDNHSRGKNRIKGVRYIYGDVSNEGTCRDTFRHADCIFNLAATVAGVIYNQQNHAKMFVENLAVQATPLKVAAEYGVPYYLHVSSVCVYAPGHNAPCLEENGFLGEPVGANAGYSWAKRMGERLAMWYAQEQDLHVIRVRPSNVFGPRDYFDDLAHVIPALIKKALDDDTIVVNGTGHERREFVYVDDVAMGMMAALERGAPGDVYNLGTNGQTCVEIRRLLLMIQELTGTQHKSVEFSSRYDAGDDERWSDAVRANCDLGWYPRVGLEEGLKRTVEWYANHRDG
jgi:nucleoside-diphosphate-sugar epimerase